MAVATQPDGATLNLTSNAIKTAAQVEPGILIYPSDMRSDQDRIKFTVREVQKTSIVKQNQKILSSKTANNIPEAKLPPGETSSVYLPIQSAISDTNSVEWGGEKLNEIQRRLVNASLDAMNSKANFGEATQDMINQIYNGILKQKGFGGMARIALAEQAVGVQGLLSRVTGNVLNPNLELLFQGPTLRPFQFQFKLSPRTQKEAEDVKRIIKFFKKNMAVRSGESGLFLKSPYVFGIEYQQGTKDKSSVIHPSIGRVKPCALQSFNVDYTPLGSYMTYDDAKSTMVAYNISMQFQEIVPVTSGDYKDGHDIGF